MLMDVQFSPPRCRECSRPMRLISVFCSRGDIQPPVKTFECPDCGTEVIWQQYPPPDRRLAPRNSSPDNEVCCQE